MYGLSFIVFNLSEVVANSFNFCVRLIKIYIQVFVNFVRVVLRTNHWMIKTILYNNKVIISETTASIAALHDVETALYASDLNGFTTNNTCQFRNIRIVLLIQQILQSHL